MANNGDQQSGGGTEGIFTTGKNMLNKLWRGSGGPSVEDVDSAAANKTQSDSESRRFALIKKNHITREPLQLGLCVICENTATREITIEDKTFSLCKIHHTEHEVKPITMNDINKEEGETTMATEIVETTGSETENMANKLPEEEKASSDIVSDVTNQTDENNKSSETESVVGKTNGEENIKMHTNKI
ncbi:hypothetical protein B566_EDAN016184 [Ephemera danica]|nr:hypothetical protein B566_EDAN016184 [Ephemera danica]